MAGKRCAHPEKEGIAGCKDANLLSRERQHGLHSGIEGRGPGLCCTANERGSQRQMARATENMGGIGNRCACGLAKARGPVFADADDGQPRRLR